MEKATPSTTVKQRRHWAVQVGLGVGALILAYLSASFAIDRGSALAYALCFILLVFGTRELILAVRDSWRKRK
jgi:hypothetical protein